MNNGLGRSHRDAPCIGWLLAARGALMSGTYSSARKAKRLFGELIQQQAEEHLRKRMDGK